MANVIKHKRGSGSDPVASDLVVGEVAIRTDVGKLFTKMDNGSVAEIAGGGSDIAINTLSSSSGTGGGSATFNGSAYRFTLSAPPSISAQQLLVSINGVIQKPVAGTGQPSEGFSVDGTDIILGDAPATGSDFFILTFKSLGVSEPADNSVTSAKIVDGAIVNADINASAAIAGSKISTAFTSNISINTGSTTNDLSATNILRIMGNDVRITNAAGSEGMIFAAADGAVSLFHGMGSSSTAEAKLATTSTGVSVTGAITGTGDLTIDTNTLHVDSSNNRVGIGTTSPTQLLHLKGGAPAIEFEDTGANGSAISVIEDNNGFLKFRCDAGNAGTGSGIGFEVDALEKMRVNSDGNLLIGKTNTLFTTDGIRLDGTGLITISRTSSSTVLGTSNGGCLSLCNPSATDNNFSNVGFYKANGLVTSQINGITTNQSSRHGALAFLVHDGSTLGEKVRITKDGNVGIGTTSPAKKLHVFESGAASIRLETGDSRGQAFDFLSTNGAQNNTGTLSIRNESNQTFVDFAMNEGSPCTKIYNTGTEKLRIDSSGRVLIGTTTEGASTADDLTIATSGNTGISLRSGTASNGNIFFSDGTSGDDELRGYIQYDHSINAFNFGTDKITRITINSSGNVGIGTSSPSTTLHVAGDTQFTTSTGVQFPFNFRNDFTPNSFRSDLLSTINVTSNNALRIGSVASSGGVTLQGNRANDSSLKVGLLLNPDGGNVAVGTSTTTGKFSVENNNTVDPTQKVGFFSAENTNFSGKVLQVGCKRDTSADLYQHFSCSIIGVAEKMVVQNNGDVENTNNNYGSLSDETLKENIVDADSQWNDIKNIKVRKFNFKSLTDPNKKTMLGVVAQEAELVCPNLVTTKVSLQEGVEKEYKSFKYSVLYMKAIKCLQEAISKIETLETKVAALEAS